MLISLIAAMDQNRGIGLRGRIPWRLSADLKHFKAITMGHYLIQGRKTWESIGRPLPGRKMVVVTRNPNYPVPAGVAVAHSLEAALEIARREDETEAFIGGGGGLYTAALPRADRIHLTRVQAAVEADTFFPPFDETAWDIAETFEHPADDRNEFPFRYELLIRK